MGRLFNYDNVVFRTINKIVDCMLLSILWIIFSIPIITIGASSTALYYTVNKVIIHNNSYIWREFWKAFKSNFKQSTIVWLILMVIYWILVADCYLMYIWQAAGKFPTFVLVIFICFTVMVTMWTSYLFPYIARFSIKTKLLFKNCVYMSIRHFFTSIMLVVTFGGCVLLFVFVPITGFFLPVGCSAASCFFIEKVFYKYMSDEDREAEEERNRNYYN